MGYGRGVCKDANRAISLVHVQMVLVFLKPAVKNFAGEERRRKRGLNAKCSKNGFFRKERLKIRGL